MKFDTDFEYDEWCDRKRNEKIADDYFLKGGIENENL